jgi:hypothetical protein
VSVEPGCVRWMVDLAVVVAAGLKGLTWADPGVGPRQLGERGTTCATLGPVGDSGGTVCAAPLGIQSP